MVSDQRGIFLLGRGVLAPIEGDAWYQVDLIASGNRFQTLVNGRLVSDRDDEGRAFRRGAVAIRAGPGRRVEYRDIELKELPSPGATGATGGGGPTRRPRRGGRSGACSSTSRTSGGSRRPPALPRVRREELTESARTAEYVELERPGRVVRLYADHAAVGPDRDMFTPLAFVGGWE